MQIYLKNLDKFGRFSLFYYNFCQFYLSETNKAPESKTEMSAYI